MTTDPNHFLIYDEEEEKLHTPGMLRTEFPEISFDLTDDGFENLRDVYPRFHRVAVPPTPVYDDRYTLITLSDPVKVDDEYTVEWVLAPNLDADINVLHDSKSLDIDRYCEEAINRGFYADILGEEHFYKADRIDQHYVMANVVSALVNKADPEKAKPLYHISYKDGLRQINQYTDDQIIDLGRALENHVWGYLHHANMLKIQLEQYLLNDDKEGILSVHWAPQMPDEE